MSADAAKVADKPPTTSAPIPSTTTEGNEKRLNVNAKAFTPKAQAVAPPAANPPPKQPQQVPFKAPPPPHQMVKMMGGKMPPPPPHGGMPMMMSPQGMPMMMQGPGMPQPHPGAPGAPYMPMMGPPPHGFPPGMVPMQMMPMPMAPPPQGGKQQHPPPPPPQMQKASKPGSSQPTPPQQPMMMPPGFVPMGMPMQMPPGSNMQMPFMQMPMFPMMPPPGSVPMGMVPPSPQQHPPIMQNKGPRTSLTSQPTVSQPALAPSMSGTMGSMQSSQASHPVPASPQSPARVSVGNATLAALTSKEPPKFSCVLLSGIPAVGKTSLGRELVNSLKTDGMGWAFFSGADFLADAPQGKRSVWDTTKEVYDALSDRLDELLEQQREKRNIKGLVIDKNCKGIEDVYYLNALLKAKQIPFVGIVGMECDDDAILVQRMGGDDYLKEKLKFHRVIHTRIVSVAKGAGMYRHVDATKSKEEVVQSLRTMVLGCCAQPPSRNFAANQYEDSRVNGLVDSYKEYCAVMTHLFNSVNPRNHQFPGTTEFTSFSSREISEKSRISAIKARYGIRRKVDGHRYLLLYYDGKLYLVPPHMRAVLHMPSKAWLGSRLDRNKIGTFVLEGDLARLTHDRQKEIFLVYDALFWSDAEQPSTNVMIRMTFPERQELLAANLCKEDRAFYSQDTECVVVHQTTHKLAESIDMLDSEQYPSDGLVFQPINPVSRSDHVLVWRQPSCMTADFRVGELKETRQPSDSEAHTAAEARRSSLSAAARRGSLESFIDTPARTYALEVYDKNEKAYVPFEEAVVEVRHPDVVEGCIVTCSLVDAVPRRWTFCRIRYDVARPIYKHDLEELLRSCLVPRAKLVSWLMAEQFVPSEIQPAKESSATTPFASRTAHRPTNIPTAPPPSYEDAAAVSAAAAAGAARTVYPSASALLGKTAIPAAPVAALPPTAVPASAISTNEQIQKLAAIFPSLHVVTDPAEAVVPGACAQCHRTKQSEDLRMDRRDHKYYCYHCWSKMGHGFCSQCGDFKVIRKGRNNGPSVCDACAKGRTAGATEAASEGKNSAAAPTNNSNKGKEPKAKKEPKNSREPKNGGVKAAPETASSTPEVEGAVAAAGEERKKPANKNKKNKNKKEVESPKEGEAPVAAEAVVLEEKPQVEEAVVVPVPASEPAAEQPQATSAEVADPPKQDTEEKKSGGGCRQQ